MPIGASSLILCERVIADRLEGRTYLFRVITEFRASVEPTSPIGFSVFSLLTGETRQEGRVRLRCVSSDSGEVEWLQDFGKVRIGKDGKRQLHLRCEDFVFPKYGNYEFQLEIEDIIVGKLSVHVGPR
jgi:hypothetical protein